MPRSYDVRTAALAVGSDLKWLDNLLSRHRLPGVSGGRQGLARRISDEGLLAIALARSLNQDVGVSVDRAVELTSAALLGRDRTSTRVALGPAVDLVLDLPAFEAKLRGQVIHAMETIGHVRRGRPPRQHHHQ